MRVKDVMHRGVTWVQPETPIREVARRMPNDDIGSIPIGENDRLIGMVTDRDIIYRGIADGANVDVLIRRLPVIDKDKRLTGMLALRDILKIGGDEMAGEVMRSISAHHA
jgi:CBS domain-containing protein